MINFNQINDVHKLALKYAINYELHYDEYDNTWYYVLSSAASSENWIGKNRSSFEIATKETVERLKSYA